MVVLGRLDRVVVDTVCIAARRLGGVQAGLGRVSNATRHNGGQRGVACAAYLDEVLALWLGDEWLQLGCGEGVDEPCLGHDEQQDLGAGENRQFVGLAWGETG